MPALEKGKANLFPRIDPGLPTFLDCLHLPKRRCQLPMKVAIDVGTTSVYRHCGRVGVGRCTRFRDQSRTDFADRARGERGCAGDRRVARACPFNRVVEHVREDLPPRLATRAACVRHDPPYGNVVPVEEQYRLIQGVTTPSITALARWARVCDDFNPTKHARAFGSMWGVRSPLRYGAKNNPSAPGAVELTHRDILSYASLSVSSLRRGSTTSRNHASDAPAASVAPISVQVLSVV